jgi:hypothetical protein
MKRKLSAKDPLKAENDHGKRLRQNEPLTFQETDSIRQQAKPYRMTTARIPIDALTCTWSIGKNRRIDQQHVQKLFESFMRGELARQSEENYILVQCSAELVQRAMRETRAERGDDNNESWRLPMFDNWMDVNDEKPEVLAGQHRIEALRQYVKKSDGDVKDLWWVCEFYDKGKL